MIEDARRNLRSSGAHQNLPEQEQTFSALDVDFI